MGLEPEWMDFEWDPAKDAANEQKHGIAFEDAKAVFRDPQVLIEDVSKPEHGERRSKAIGRVDTFVAAVIFTDRNGVNRIISARRAKRNERERYRASAESA
jgi:uncharacterized DUF497 family protein